MRVVATAAALSILPLLHTAVASDDRSLTDIESRIGISRTQVPDPDSNTIGALKEKLLLAETTISALTATVAEMGNSAEATRRELEDANLRIENVAVSSSDSKTEVLESRLLQCLRELRVLRDSNEAARGQLLILSEAVQMLMLTSADTNPQSRMTVEAELRKTNEVLGAAPQGSPKAASASLKDGLVIDSKNEISLIVINLGAVTGTLPTGVFKIQGSADGGTTWLDLPLATTASLTVTGVYGIQIYPALTPTAGAATTGSIAVVNSVLPRTWRVVWTLGGTTPSFTITNIQVNYLI